MNCIKIGLLGKLILSKRKGLLKIVSENQFSGKTYFYTMPPGQNPEAAAEDGQEPGWICGWIEGEGGVGAEEERGDEGEGGI